MILPPKKLFICSLLCICLCETSLASEENLVELCQNVYAINLTQGSKYNPLDTARSVGNFVFEWKLSTPSLPENFLLTIRSRESSLKLISSKGDFLNVILMDGRGNFTPITLFNLLNFNEAAIEIDVEYNSMVLRYPIRVIIPEEQKVRPGTYKTFIDVGIYTLNGRELEVKTVQMTCEVEDYQKISFKINQLPQSSNYPTLDFGEITNPTTKAIDLHLQSNISYEFYISSLNQGKLVLGNEWLRSHYECKVMDYECAINGNKISLSGQNKLILDTCLNAGIIDRIEHFSITVFPDVSKNWEGIYEDEITFSVQPIY